MDINKNKKLVMFDGNAILHRAYHAFPQTLRTRSGELTNATYGFTSTLLNVFKKMKPSHVIVAFDEKEKTFRHKEYREYKASRPKMDDELVSQINRTREVVKTMNIPMYAISGFEADDALGTLSKMAEKDDFDEIVIVTGDKDILQLLSKKTKVFFPARGRFGEKFYDEETFIKEYGFEPVKMIDFKALAGDKSDEIPGVRGIGPKTATLLIKAYGTLEGIYENLDKISENTQKKLKEDKEMAYLSKRLATIKTDVSVDFNDKDSMLKEYDKENVLKLFEELEFFSLIRRLPSDSWEEMVSETFVKKEEKQKEIEDKQMSLF